MASSSEAEALEAFLESMARLPSAVHIVTAHHGGRDYGMTVTAVTSLSTSPASFLLSINRAAAAHDAILATGELCLNTLKTCQSDLARTFSGMTGIRGQKRFAQGAWELGGGQPAALRDAAARMLGTILQSHVIGSHRVFACAASRVTLGQEPHALVYGNRRFGAVAYMEE